MDQKHTWLIKICSLIAAFSLWLYISSLDNNQFTKNVSIPVTVQGLENVKGQKLRLLPPSQPYEVTLNVRGSLTDIALGKDKIKAVADFSEFVFTKGERTIPVKIESQPDNISISNSSNLYIKVVFDELKEKNMPIKLSVMGKAKEGFYNLSESLSPTDAVITGAAKFIDQVSKVEVNVDLKNADKDLNLKLPLKAYDAAGREVSNVDIIPASVDVNIPIRRTKTVSINVQTKGNINKDYVLKSITPVPDKVDIAGGEDIVNINSLNTEVIDLNTLTPNKIVVAKIIKPEGVNLINSDGTVKLKVVMDKIIEKKFTLDIKVKKANDTFNITLDNSKFNLNLSGPESQINALKNEDFNCQIDVSSINSEGDHSVRVTYTIPDGVTKISAAPENVKVTFKKVGEQTGNTTTPNTTQTNGGQ